MISSCFPPSSLRGPIKTHIRSCPSSAPNPPLWSKAQVLSMAPRPSPFALCAPCLSGPSPMTFPRRPRCARRTHPLPSASAAGTTLPSDAHAAHSHTTPPSAVLKSCFIREASALTAVSERGALPSHPSPSPTPCCPDDYGCVTNHPKAQRPHTALSYAQDYGQGTVGLVSLLRDVAGNGAGVGGLAGRPGLGLESSEGLLPHTSGGGCRPLAETPTHGLSTWPGLPRT